MLLTIDNHSLQRNGQGTKCLTYHWKSLMKIQILLLSISWGRPLYLLHSTAMQKAEIIAVRFEL